MATTTTKKRKPPTAEQLAEHIDNWFPRWKAEHLARCYRNDWPTDPLIAEPFWGGWKSKLRRSGATYACATEASEDVAALALYPNEQLNALMKCVQAIHKRLNADHERIRDGDITAARDATDPNCECSKSGMVVRYRHASVREGKGSDAAGTQYVCHCLCPVGQWMRANLESENRRLFVNLASHPALHVKPVAWSDVPDNQFRYHPDDWDSDMGCPVASPSQWREHVNMLREEGIESLRKYWTTHEPRPYVPRRLRSQPVPYRDPTPEDREKADAWKQQHLPPAPAPPEPAPAEASAEPPPF